MTNPENIIEAARELREWQQRLKAHGCTDKLAEEQWRKGAWYAFPSIVKAFLIAVDTLENIEGEYCGCDCKEAMKESAQEALSRICSLPAS